MSQMLTLGIVLLLPVSIRQSTIRFVHQFTPGMEWTGMDVMIAAIEASACCSVALRCLLTGRISSCKMRVLPQVILRDIKQCQ